MQPELGMFQPFGFQVQGFHFLLHFGMGVLKSFTIKRVDVGLAEVNRHHNHNLRSVSVCEQLSGDRRRFYRLHEKVKLLSVQSILWERGDKQEGSMRKFFSYGQLDTELHYYTPRTALIETAYRQMLGDDPDKGGHYMTVWAPRQTGKSWVMLQVVQKIKQLEAFEVGIITMQSAKEVTSAEGVLGLFTSKLRQWFRRDFPEIRAWEHLPGLFTQDYFPKPLILIIDEFDAMGEAFISKFANEFRSMYTERLNEADTPAAEKSCFLHGLALVGVRSVLGIENAAGSPFNVQRSLHIPNLTFEEVEGMFTWYECDSNQKIEHEVIERLYYETDGQPGLTCWFGELLTEGFEDYHLPQHEPITMPIFEDVYAAALDLLPNNTILNIISKAQEEPYQGFVLEMFRTDHKIKFRYDDPRMNYLYMNGVIAHEKAGAPGAYAKFSCPFVQKRLFNRFSNELFRYIGKVYDVFENLDDTITDEALNIRNLLKRYEGHLRNNRDWLLKDAPRRADLRIYEAVYHFNLYMYLSHFLQAFGGSVYPEFPTGNGKIDLIIEYAGKTYGVEVKSFSTHKEYQDALIQAARYGQHLKLPEIALVVFVDTIDEANRNRYEVEYRDQNTGVNVIPVFVETAH